MDGLIVVEINKPAKPEKVSPEDTKKIREQAEMVLAKHRNDLPREIVIELTSPRLTIVSMGLRDAAGWLANRNSLLKEEYCRNHVYYDEVRDLLGQIEVLVSGKFGAAIKIKLSSRNRAMLEMDMYQILRGNRIEQLKACLKQAQQIRRFEAKATPKPTKSTKKRPRPAPAGPILHEIIVVGEQPRVRKPKETKAVFAGLPPVPKDCTDTPLVDTKPYAKIGKANEQGGPVPRRGETIAKSQKAKQKGQRGGGVKTHPGRRN